MSKFEEILDFKINELNFSFNELDFLTDLFSFFIKLDASVNRQVMQMVE
jgi:hypothetical protein